MDLLLLLPLTILFTLLTTIYLYSRSANYLKARSGNPNSIVSFIKNRNRLVEWTADLLLSSPTGTMATFIGVATVNPVNVEHILKTNFHNYIKGERSASLLQDFLGHGIFVADGDHWKLQRRTASLEFGTKTVRSFVMDNVNAEVVDRLLPLLSAARDEIDLQDVLEKFAFDNVCKVIFNEDTARLGEDTAEGREFHKAFEAACSLSIQRFRYAIPYFWKLERLLRVGAERRLGNHIDTVHRYAMRAVNRRRQSSLGDDLVSRFIAEDAGYSDEFLRDIVTNFVLAGRDTTSATLTWFFWLISTRPEVKRKIEDEILRVRGANTNPISLDEVKEMYYLHAALSETLRLYPPAPLPGRFSVGDDVLPDGTRVRKGVLVIYSSYAMGRSKKIWGEDCEEFRPERWLENGVFQQKSPYQFPVFHAGPRMCLGKDMAYIQMKVVAASIMERFEIDVVDKEVEREQELTMIMKLKGSLMVRVREKTVENQIESSHAQSVPIPNSL